MYFLEVELKPKIFKNKSKTTQDLHAQASNHDRCAGDNGKNF